MGSKGLIIFSLFLVCVIQQFGVDAVITYKYSSCSIYGNNYTEGSKYQQNLNFILSNLSSKASTNNIFYNYTTGDAPNKVYGQYQCRGDVVGTEICAECIQGATQKIVQQCPLFKIAVTWYEECILIYSNRSVSDTYTWLRRASTRKVLEYDELAPVLGDTLNRVINEAEKNSSKGHFATAKATWGHNYSVFCLAQCTHYLDDFDCKNCLSTARSAMINENAKREWVIVFYTNCQLRYDTSKQFYLDIAPSPSPSPSSTPSNTTSLPGLTPPRIVGIAVAGAVGFIVLLASLWFCLCSKKFRKITMSEVVFSQPPIPIMVDEENLGDVGFVQYDFDTLKVATRGFSADNKLGQGGFGAVYKGTLASGEEVAIKRLSSNSTQGVKEFTTEAHLLAKLQHKNLVQLLGFCSEGDEKLLVYEYLPNTSLDRFLLIDPWKPTFLDWEIRYKIIVGIARGVHYLHEDSRITIIHRDLKTSNILLDIDMDPKISDFGMARLFGKEQMLENTSRVVGTLGYMSPEYLLTGEYSNKSDVYSFGIIILELVNGQKNRLLNQSSQREDLPIRAWRLWNAGISLELLDPKLHNNHSKTEVMRCIQIGLLCVQQNAMHRPTMAAIMLMLTSSIPLPSLSEPALPPQEPNQLLTTDVDQEISPR